MLSCQKLQTWRNKNMKSVKCFCLIKDMRKALSIQYSAAWFVDSRNKTSFSVILYLIDCFIHADDKDTYQISSESYCWWSSHVFSHYQFQLTVKQTYSESIDFHSFFTLLMLSTRRSHWQWLWLVLRLI